MIACAPLCMTGNVPDGLKAKAIAAGKSMIMCNRNGTEAQVRYIGVKVEYLELAGQSEIVVQSSSATMSFLIRESASKW